MADEKTGLVSPKKDDHRYGSKVSGGSTNLLRHKLLPTDTLAGLCIKYDVKREEVLKVNKLFRADDMFLLDTLLIPCHGGSPSGGSSPLPSPASARKPVTPSSSSSSANASPSVNTLDSLFARFDANLSKSKAEVAKHPTLPDSGRPAATYTSTRKGSTSGSVLIPSSGPTSSLHDLSAGSKKTSGGQTKKKLSSQSSRSAEESDDDELFEL
eukprot:m.178380 g.178380  ORF g.178380 m.178380 type:complete len:212 (-) comp17393_c0_seq2:3066-3701(-)